MKIICAAIVLLAVACSFTEAQPGDFCYVKTNHDSECNTRQLRYRMKAYNVCEVVNPANGKTCLMGIPDDKCQERFMRAFAQPNHDCAVDHFRSQ